MKVSPTIDLEEAVTILREELARRAGHEIMNIFITSHNKVKIQIEEDGMVDCQEFRHNIG
jgi:hypothetical protein